MLTLLQAIFAFLITLAILVTVHEWGHYWVAKRLGVKILRFSVGFGKPLLQRRFGADQTEFMLAPIPLGGYVKMLDENEGEVPAEEVHRAFNRQALWKRAAIVVAGPLVNFLFAILAFTLMFMLGVKGLTPFIGEVTPDSIADHGGLKANQQIIQVNQQPTLRWESVIHKTLETVLDKENAEYAVRDEQGRTSLHELALDDLVPDDFTRKNLFDKLGFKVFRPRLPPVVGKILPDSAAQKAGLQVNDEMRSLSGEKTPDWKTWASIIAKNPEQMLVLEVLRNGQILALDLTPKNRDGKGFAGVGPLVPDEWPPAKYYSTEQYNLWAAVPKAVDKTWQMTVLSLRMMAKMLTLEVSPKNISGPVRIAEYAGHSWDLGVERFLFFLGLISLSLGIINLLPIPMLDGGHLLFYLVEWVKGSPLSENMMFFWQKIGITLVLMLMMLALYNDFLHLFE